MRRPEGFFDRVLLAQRYPANPVRLKAENVLDPPQNKKDYTSEIIWGLLGLVALAWELYCVFTEKRTGHEPLTRLVRDRLFVMGGTGIVFRLLGIAGSLWLALHFFAPDFIPGAVL